ncbi:hypothetical protein [Nocardia alba]|uniref:Uncharacterized protein n=1 Tax=Nocardia alba TaxID=225051 RepID=A0A4R1FV16_9NOCA|nr:hypothetical protein [Nocardia alba]TCJ97722.1 hypothetical protein DFR71_3771 [Nocardia alba]
MSAFGTWRLKMESTLGNADGIVEIAQQPDGSLTGTARSFATGESFRVWDVEYSGDTLVWRQLIKKPVRLNLSITVRIDGDEMTGTAKPRMMPGIATVSGQRVSIHPGAEVPGAAVARPLPS